MKTIRIITIALLLFTGFNALYAGACFMIEPSGAYLRISTDLLRHSFFRDFFIPGLILFCCIGLLSCVAALFTIMQWKGYAMLVRLQGVILMGWILVQVLLFQQVNALHAGMATIGLLLFLFGNRMNV